MTVRVNAKLDDFILDMETIHDTIEKEIAEYEFSYRDGADLDDRGAHARRITFRCHFLGDDYDRHVDFINHVSETGDHLYKLTHPVYGIIEGKVKRIDILKPQDTVDDAPVDIDFTEQMHGESDFGAVPVTVNVISNMLEDEFQLGQLEQMAQVASDLFDSIGAEANDIINQVLTPGQKLVDKFVDASLSARDVLNAIDSGIAQAGALLSSTTVPQDDLVSIIDYPATLPGLIVSTFAGAGARQAQSLLGLASSPDHYIQALASSLAGASGQFSDNLFPLAKHAAIGAAQTLSLQAAYRYDEDEQRRQVLKTTEGKPSFAMDGTYLNPPQPEQIMTVDQLESTLSLVRQNLQEAIVQARDMGSLKSMAASLLRHVNTVKLERESIVTKTYAGELPLHVLCVRENIPYNYAERICSINPSIKNPSFVSGEVEIYAR
jgi:DNA circularisation protein N-terminus